MKFDLLPAGWKPWHPLVFGILAKIGADLASPLMDFLLEMVRKVSA